MSFNYLNDSDVEDLDENDIEFNIQDSIIFLVDGTKQMYETGYFIQCLETYKDIVRQKCACNKNDKMGLITFGTEDTNCELKNVMILQEFSTVTMDMLNNIRSILKDKANKYKQLASESKGSLYDVLAYVLQILQSYKNIKTRNLIVLCTCNDNPSSDNISEQRRIKHLVATFKDSQIELRVVGLSDFWNDELYYKQLQIIAGTYSINNYKRLYLKDFIQHVLYSARSMSTLPWNFSKDISIGVSILSLYSSSTYPQKKKLEKEENEILGARQILCKEISENSQSENLNDSNKEVSVISKDHIEYYKTYGGLRVAFNASEHKQIRHLGLTSGIEILAFKPIVCDPMYHCKAPYFVTYSTSSNEDSQAFFLSFIKKCSEKQVMPICSIVRKIAVTIVAMIPSEEDGGFYMCKIPFSGAVRNLDPLLESFIYNSTNKCPLNENAVDMFKRLIELSTMEFDPYKFTNPKLEKCMAHIEAIAFDDVLDYSITDTTLPPPISPQVEVLKVKLTRELNLNNNVQAPKSWNNSQNREFKRKKLDIPELAKNKKLQQLTVAELREYLKSMGQSTLGNKSNLIDRITNYVDK